MRFQRLFKAVLQTVSVAILLNGARPTWAKLSVEQEVKADNQTIAFIPGSFDPPTRGHLKILLQAFERFHADRLVIMINTLSGPKDFPASYEQRKEMLSVMLGSYLDKIEFIHEPIGGAPSAIDALAKTKENTIIALIGEDAFLKPSRIPDNVRYQVIQRPGLEKTIEPDDHIGFVSLPGIEGLSSSKARQAIREGDENTIRANLAPSVQSFIQEKKLYIAPSRSEISTIQSEFESEYVKFQRSIQLHFPGIKVEFPVLKFEPTQSPASWHEKFVKAIRGQPGFERVVLWESGVDCLVQNLAQSLF